jgi:hypothetical protein
MASRTFTQTPYYSQYDLQIPSEAFVNIDNVVFSDEIESNFQKASKKINKSLEGPKKMMRKKHNRARNPWTPQEDVKLVELMKKHGQSWAMISASMEGRTGKQIRDRFLNKLRPNIKCGDWTVEEDELMIRLLNEIGNRWSLIATHLPGRTEGQVKNRYYSSIKKRLETNGVFSQTSSASASEVVSSFPTSPEAEEPKFDFGFDFDASVMNHNAAFNQESVVKNNTMISKGPYAFEEDNSDETSATSQSESPYRTTEPVSTISYDFSENFFFGQPQHEAFFVPTIEHDNQIDDVLGNVASYFLDNSSAPSDVDSYFADDLKSQKKNAQLDVEALSSDKLAQLSRRKALLELALAKTLKEIKSL